MIKGISLPCCFDQVSSWVASCASVLGQTGIRSIFLVYFSNIPAKAPKISAICSTRSHLGYAGAAKCLHISHNCTGIGFHGAPDFFCMLQSYRFKKHFSTATGSRIPWEGSSRDALLRKLENSLKERRVREAWEAFNDFKSLYGFPAQCLVSRLIIQLSYSSDCHWLHEVYYLVLVILKEKSNLLGRESLTIVSLMLARAKMPLPASTVLRLMMERDEFLSLSLCNTVFLHMVKTQIGTYLASEMLVEICEYSLHDHSRKRHELSKCANPSTTIFNLVLNACVRFGSTLKAQEIIELMPRVGIRANASSIVIMALIYEKNGQREELKKLKEHVDDVSISLDRYYHLFYDSLLSLHFKFNDIDAAAELMLDVYRCRKSLHLTNRFLAKDRELQRPCLLHIGPQNLRTGVRMRIEPELLGSDLIVEVESRPELVIFMDGRLVVSNKALAMLVNGYLKDGKVGQLVNFLVSIQKMGTSEEGSLSSEVISACIQMGWLETAHDILDDMESALVRVGSDLYLSLLRAYCEGNQLKEAKALVKQMRKAGLLTESSDEQVISSFLSGDGTVNPLGETNMKNMNCKRKSGLAEFLVGQKREELIPPLVYEINSSIYFFCKAKMIEDALKTFQRMQEMKLQPTVQTFSYLISGCSSLQLYREITILWGEIRRRRDNGVLASGRDLYESLLWNFIRGGYFEIALDVINYMEKHSMFIDKWKYKREFLKFHKDLYRSLQASKAKTEAQSKRLEHVRAFRLWVGIN